MHTHSGGVERQGFETSVKAVCNDDRLQRLLLVFQPGLLLSKRRHGESLQYVRGRSLNFRGHELLTCVVKPRLGNPLRRGSSVRVARDISESCQPEPARRPLELVGLGCALNTRLTSTT